MNDIGIIGGADGPTAVFVAASPDWWYLPAIAAAVIAATIVLLAVRKRKGR